MAYKLSIAFAHFFKSIHSVRFTILLVLGIFDFSLILFISFALSLNPTFVGVAYRIFYLCFSIYIVYIDNLKSRITAPYILFFYIFYLIYLIHLMSDVLLIPTLLQMSPMKYVFYAVGVVLIPTIAFLRFPENKEIEKAITIIYIVSLMICVLALIENYQTEVNGFKRLAGFSEFHPISLGHIAVTNIILSLYLPKTKFVKLMMPSILLSLTVLILSNSRGPWISLIVTITVLLGINKSKLFAIGNKYLSHIIFLTLFIISVILIWPRTLERIDYTINMGDQRLYLWKDSILQFLQHPISGNHIELLNYKTYSHNLFVEALMVTGVVGFSCLVFFIIKTFKSLVAILQLSAPHQILGLLYVQYFIGAMFSGSIITNYIFWYFSFLILAFEFYKPHFNNKLNFI